MITKEKIIEILSNYSSYADSSLGNIIREEKHDIIAEDILSKLRQPPVSGQLNCEHDWLVDMYDHFGFPASRFCDKCNTREAI